MSIVLFSITLVLTFPLTWACMMASTFAEHYQYSPPVHCLKTSPSPLSPQPHYYSIILFRSRAAITLKLILFSCGVFLSSLLWWARGSRWRRSGTLNRRLFPVEWVTVKQGRERHLAGRRVSSGSSGMFYWCDLRHTWRGHGVMCRRELAEEVVPQFILLSRQR